MRRLLNHLCGPNLATEHTPSYLEVGLYCGASFCSSICNNPRLRAYGVDNFSQDFGEPAVRAKLSDALAVYQRHPERCQIFEGDFFSMDLSVVPRPIDVFYYDGIHSFEHQRDCLARFIPLAARQFIWIVDDYHWESVHEGTKEAIKLASGDVSLEFQTELSGVLAGNDPVWHNGVWVSVVSRL